MLTVRDILDRKGRNVWTITPDAPVYHALELMAEKRVGALLVLERERLVGVVSERDYARKVILAGKASKETPVRDIMTSKVYYVTPSHRLDECMALMTDKAVRHFPVMDGERLDGVISIGDVVKAVISHQEFLIEQLEHFIMGR
jgi:CBS domain-containing protein